MSHGARGWGACWAWVLLAVACERPEQLAAPSPSVEAPPAAASSLKEKPLTGRTRWLRSLTGAGRESAAGLAHDSRGNVVLALNSEAAVADLFGPLLVPGSGAPSSQRFGVAKYGTGGERMWSTSLPGFAEAVTVSSRGHVLVAGRNPEGADLGGGPLPAGRFLLKLGRDGDFLWARSLGALGVSPDFVLRRVETDLLGNVVLAGTLPDAKLGGVPALVKVDAKGGYLWTYAHEEPGEASGVAADPEGHLYVTGLLHPPRSPVALDSQPFLVKLDARGRAQWEQRLDTGAGGATGVAVHGNRVLVTGAFFAPLTFEARTHAAEPGGSEAFVAAFDREGTPRWLRTFGFEGLDLATDEDDGVTVVGRYAHGDDLGAGPVVGAPGGALNLFLVKLDRVDGALRWARGFPMAPSGDGDSFAERCFVSSSRKGASALLGARRSSMDFGTGVLSEPEGGGQELFLGGFEP
ncbi:PQQ-binding-like beta-propeller repeat protein [Myxococcus eversor]|uniref:outer membrane protein assembly factor BamB family protein n=1 Tax=Myxococcus eversor TaxID=2709661 RepID=UPI0013D2C99B|nr:PQQ-binding-like beta-propeller repeat protein [Myxococcus eversor]